MFAHKLTQNVKIHARKKIFENIFRRMRCSLHYAVLRLNTKEYEVTSKDL